MSQITHEEALALITPFYNLFRHDKRDWEAGFASLAEDWQTYDGNDTQRGKIATRGFLAGFFAAVPDINVENLQLVVDGDWIAVRSELTGTPAVDGFFGVPGHGRRFHIMAIDFNQVRDGKLARLYHVENWAIAAAQLRGELE
jgi:predicted ester cyclase